MTLWPFLYTQDVRMNLLFSQCGYNSDEALRRRRMSGVPHTDTMSLWSEEECRAFELGLRYTSLTHFFSNLLYFHSEMKVPLN